MELLGYLKVWTNMTSVFHGIGKIRDNKNNKELYVRFSMKPDVVSVAPKPRQVPYYLLKLLKDCLDHGLKSDIFDITLYR